MNGIHIRPATRADVGFILTMIRELAEYEKLLHEVEATERMLEETLFSDRPYAEVLIGELAGEPNGFALFFHNYSTFLGRPGIYLEDLYVRREARGQGLGKALLCHLARIAEERACGRIDWSVLDWNTPSIAFYEALGADIKREWLLARVHRDSIPKLARK